MEGYGCMFRGYTVYNRTKPGTGDWTKSSYSNFSTMGPHSEDQSKTNIVTAYPIMQDEEGSKRLVLPFGSNHSTNNPVTGNKLVDHTYSTYGNEYKHNSPPKADRDDKKWNQPTTPVHVHVDRAQKIEEFIIKFKTEVSRPAKFSPLTTTDWHRYPHSTGLTGTTSHPGYSDYNSTGLNGAAGQGGYGDYRNKEWHNSRPSGLIDTGNGGYGDYINKHGHTPHSMGLSGTIRNGGYDDYSNKDGHTGGYGGYYNKKEGQSPHLTGPSGTTGYGGYGEYRNKEGHNPRPIGLTSAVGNGDYRNKEGHNRGGYGDYSNKGQPPRSMGLSGSPGYSGYGDYGNKEEHNSRPIGTTGYGDYVDYSNKEVNNPPPAGLIGSTGHGGYGDYKNKEGHIPIGNSIRDNSYDDHKRKNDSYVEPSLTTNGNWAAPQSNGAQLSETTNDTGMVMELLKQAARSPSIANTPPQTKYSVPISSLPIKDAYKDTIDSREASRQ
ncbi:Nodulation-signaling pathway protein isoform 2 [Quillaja saponaria]|uniref:Nodulation-signaling pathway protein isoform 2 n=1 Tax=Quillaja saponaria TaxID=32244 RepID=A0AAD7Q222_QUISA|nr:Nodulation-signaling pathway protein isoform 2 [Quillaja saponaria]KAJ7973426.1 Nodulation-signaling pathway protein isoform 2 [Quillaja saponaria]